MTQNKFDLEELIIKIAFFAEYSSALKIIDFLIEFSVHIAIIVDKYGTIAEIITATNILEAIVGDINNYNKVEEALIINRKDSTWLIDGEVEFDKVLEYIGI
ncbi:MAG: hypothetical protein AB8U25_05355 [Rickettsiales endosymbiont of Dermacentor nuttalli]